MALSGATFLSLLELIQSVLEKIKPRSIPDHLSVALLLLSKGDRPTKVCVRTCVCGYPHVENYFLLHSAGTRKCYIIGAKMYLPCNAKLISASTPVVQNQQLHVRY